MLLWKSYLYRSGCLDSACFAKGAVTGIMGMNQSKKSSSTHQSLQADQVVGSIDSIVVKPLSVENEKEKKQEIFHKSMVRSSQQTQLPVVNNKTKVQQKVQHNSISQCVKSSTVFKGRMFCFSNSFPEERVS